MPRTRWFGPGHGRERFCDRNGRLPNAFLPHAQWRVCEARCASKDAEVSHTTILERRNTARRSRPTADSALHLPERRVRGERREYVPSHHITVGHVVGTSGEMGGVCSCAEHVLSRVGGTVERWARSHRQQVLAHKAVFVHSS